MLLLDVLLTVQIRDAAGNAEGAGKTAGGEAQFGRGHFQKIPGLVVDEEHVRAHFGIGPGAVRAAAMLLAGAGFGHARGGFGAGLALRQPGKVVGVDGDDIDDEIHAVQQRAGEFGLVILAAARRTAAGAGGIVEIAAAAGVHGTHELEAGGVGDVRGGTAHGGVAGFHGLAQSFQRGPGEFWHLIQEQHAAMRERDLARLGAVAAAGDGRLGCGMMRLAEGRAGDEAAVRQHAGNGMDHADFQRFARGEVWQQAGHARGEHGFAAAGRADEE